MANSTAKDGDSKWFEPGPWRQVSENRALCYAIYLCSSYRRERLETGNRNAERTVLTFALCVLASLMLVKSLFSIPIF